MIYSGLEFGQYFELERDTKCHNVLLALTPATRMAFIFIQMYFIFLNNEVGERWRNNERNREIYGQSCLPLSLFAESRVYRSMKREDLRASLSLTSRSAFYFIWSTILITSYQKLRYAVI